MFCLELGSKPKPRPDFDEQIQWSEGPQDSVLKESKDHVKRPSRITPQQYNKKTAKISQGLDFLTFW